MDEALMSPEQVFGVKTLRAETTLDKKFGTRELFNVIIIIAGVELVHVALEYGFGPDFGKGSLELDKNGIYIVP